MSHEASHDDLDEFYIRFKGDAKPYNSPLEILKDTYDRIPLTKEARERFEELFTELGTLAIKRNRSQKEPLNTASSYIESQTSSRNYVFYLAIQGNAEPFNSITEILDDIELKLSFDNPSSRREQM